MISYGALRTKSVQTYLAQFFTKKLSEQYGADISIKGVDVAFFNKVILEEVLIKDQHHDSMMIVGDMVAEIDSFSIYNKNLALKNLKLNKTKIFVSKDSARVANYNFLIQAMGSSSDNTGGWDVSCSNFIFDNASFVYSDPYAANPTFFALQDIKLEVSGFQMIKDSILLRVEQLKFNDRKNFNLQDFQANISFLKNEIRIEGLHAKTPNSVVSDADIIIDKRKVVETDDIKNLRLNIDLRHSIINMKDVAQLAPTIRGMDADLNISGHVYGTLADLKAKDLCIDFGNNTHLAFDFYMNGLPDLQNTFIQLDLKKSTTDFNDLTQLHLPNIAKRAFLNFPAKLRSAGLIEYEGNFTGFISDFVAYGTVVSDFGTIKTDIAIKPLKNNTIKVDGHVSTEDFEVGQLIGTQMIGSVTFNGKIEGVYDKTIRSFIANVDGTIKRIGVNDYEYKNINLNGRIADQMFDGKMAIEDENLKLDFKGAFDFNQEVPVFDFDLDVSKANLVALNIDLKSQLSQISFLMKANFTGDNIDNLAGKIELKNGTYSNQNGEIELKGFELKTFNDGADNLQLRSDYLDVDLKGDYQLLSIKNSLMKIASYYIPSSNFVFDPDNSENKFKFNASLKDFSKITKVFIPNFYVGPSKIDGNIDTEKNQLNLNASFPQMEYNGKRLNSVGMNVFTNSSLNIRNRIGELALEDGYSIYNLALLCSGVNDQLESQLSWNNFHQSTYSGLLKTVAKFKKENGKGLHFDLDILPTKIFIADSLWKINPARISVDSSFVHVYDFNITHGKQRIMFDGEISSDKDKKLDIRFDQIDLAYINNMLTGNLELKGILSGEASIFDLYDQTYFLSDLKIQGLGMWKQLFGDASMINKWDGRSEEILSELLVTKNHKEIVSAKGKFVPQSNELDFNIVTNGLSTSILLPFMEGSFSDFRGEIFGALKVHGKLEQLSLDGNLYGRNAGLTLLFPQTAYSFSDTIRFANDSIIFDNILVKDIEGNTAVFDGSIKHQNFENMVYDLNFMSPRILAVNTTAKDNEQFYGKVYANGSLSITGLGLDVFINAAGSTEKGTELSISLDYEEKAQEYDFISFVDKLNPEAEKRNVTNNIKSSTVTMNFDIEVTPEAKAQLIFNSQIGDVIRGNGYGNLQVGVDNDYNIVMYGDYNVVQGDYLFTLQNVINKKFDIERGGSIVWNGDPYDATINLNAVYRLKASLRELFANANSEIDYSQRIPVLCKIALTDNLINPKIGFDIDFPTSEERIKDEVRQFFTTEEDMNRQILSLLVLGRFYTPEYMRGTYESANTNVVGATAGATASELFSNQLSNWLSQISKDFDVGFNYRPGNQVTNDEVELALSTQIFNDRVTLNGNIGNNVSQATSTKNSDIVGDFDLNVKLSDDGKLQFKAFNHSNNNLIYETTPYTQGIGITYREDYNNFKELWAKFVALFMSGKKTKKKE